MSAPLQDTEEDHPYGYTVPRLSFVFCQSATRSESIFNIFQWFRRFR